MAAVSIPVPDAPSGPGPGGFDASSSGASNSGEQAVKFAESLNMRFNAVGRLGVFPQILEFSDLIRRLGRMVEHARQTHPRRQEIAKHVRWPPFRRHRSQMPGSRRTPELRAHRGRRPRSSRQPAWRAIRFRAMRFMPASSMARASLSLGDDHVPDVPVSGRTSATERWRARMPMRTRLTVITERMADLHPYG